MFNAFAAASIAAVLIGGVGVAHAQTAFPQVLNPEYPPPTLRLPTGPRPTRYELALTVVPGEAKGTGEIVIDVLANKRKADQLGKDTDAPLNDWIDIGVLDADNKPLFLEKKKIDKEETEFTVIVDKKPARAGIDPYNKLIDRRPRDNTVGVEIG